MSMAAEVELRALIDRLAVVEGREAAASALAAHLGAQGLLLFVQDPALGAFLPAPGMRKTYAGGPLWRQFLRRCLAEPRVSGMVDFDGQEPCHAEAIVDGGCAIVLLAPRGSWPRQLQEIVPWLRAVLEAQQAQHLGRAEAAEAREAASRAHALAKALDAARGAAAKLNAQLREEHERKDEFLAMLAHELRNPLAPIATAIEVLRHADRSPQSGRQLDVMARQLHQLTSIVDDLLDVSRVSRGLIVLRREPVRLDDILDHAVEACRHILEQRRHTLRRMPAGALFVNGDRVRLTQVFSNLLHNAAKYTDPGGDLTLSAVPDQARVSVVVRDNGIGIPRDMLSRVFDMFTQAPASLDRAHGGLGIGLTLVRTLVELHGGHVTAHSVGPGHGSTFTVNLPLVAAPADAPARPPVQAPVERAEGACGIAILVVDDNRDAADSLAEVLRIMGGQVDVVHDGRAALEHACGNVPRLVLLDIGLPGIDGYETAREWRRRFGGSAMLVALTGYGSPQDKRKAQDAGFDLHLTKPISMPELQQLIARFSHDDAFTEAARMQHAS